MWFNGYSTSLVFTIYLNYFIKEEEGINELNTSNANTTNEDVGVFNEEHLSLVANDDGSVMVPKVGMTFVSWELVEIMYKIYGKATGFGICRPQGADNGDGQKRAITLRCECWGSPHNKKMTEELKQQREMEIGGSLVLDSGRVKERKSKKCNCPAKLYARLNKMGLWEISNVILGHEGHQPIPSDSRLVKEYRMQSFTNNLRRRVLHDVEAGVPISQILASVARERDGLANMPITDRDMRHVVDKSRRMKMVGGDAVALMAYLERMSIDNENFFHSVRVDSTGGLQDVLWVDARSKASYEEFGDVVCFDTTYMTNDYELPFANFVGVNHHGQTTLFGCALISHEDCETFKWLFTEWLVCMGGKAPRGILTDQAAAMTKPIAEVMPETTHRWCIWHILRKIPVKFGALSKLSCIYILHGFSPNIYI